MTAEAVTCDTAVRLTVDLATFRAWCLGEPWLGELGELSEQSQQVAPVVVAAVTAVLARGENAVNLLLSSGTVRLAAHLSVADGLAAVMTLVRLGCRPRDEPDTVAWVQVALLPAGAAVEEVLRWIPLVGSAESAPRLADGTRLEVTAAGARAQPLARWQARDGLWCCSADEPDDGPAEALGEQLRRRLSAVLEPPVEPMR
ncbi:MAG: hypothetical protein IPG94_01130 [Kineosporiaceae bacterium]|nr:hypothetical protein [Kineosporiaceae bacterium]